MKATTTCLALLAAALASFGIVACNENIEPGRSIGGKIDLAIDSAGQKLATAGKTIAVQRDKAVSAVVEAAPPDASGALGDGAITASIKTDYLKDPDLSILKIEVETRDGVVTLNGLAESEPARVRAGRIAQGIKGVRDVRNYLVVKRS